MTMRVFTLQNALFIFVGLRLVVLIAETFERLRILFILSTIIVHSYFTSCIFAARTLDFAVKFRLVFRYETVVFRRYVLALLLVSLLRKFEAYLVYLSLIQSKNPRRFSFFQKFLHFTYMLLWFQLVIPSFPARIDDMRSRFSALSTRSTMADEVAKDFARHEFEQPKFWFLQLGKGGFPVTNYPFSHVQFNEMGRAGNSQILVSE